MSKSAFKRVRKEAGLVACRQPLPSHTEFGGYPIVYLFADGGALCADCLNANVELVDRANRGERCWNSHGGWAVCGADVHYEGESIACDHCHKLIESAYGVPETKEVE